MEASADGGLRKHRYAYQSWLGRVEQWKRAAKSTDAKCEVVLAGTVPEDHAPKRESDAEPGTSLHIAVGWFVVRVRLQADTPSYGKV